MMQPCASAAKLRGGGPILHRGSAAMLPLGSPPPRTVIGRPPRRGGGGADPPSRGGRAPPPPPRHGGVAERRTSLPVGPSDPPGHAGRRARPSGTLPVVASCHSPTRSFRASATISVLRVPARASAVRARYHRASALSLWCSRKRQASWIMPRRTRALPDLASPFSRRLDPLSSGDPVRPA